MTNIAEAKIQQAKDRIASYQEAIDNMDELETALKLWKHKNVDARFFLEHFKQGEQKNWQGKYCTKYNLSEPRYSFSKHNKEIYLNKDYSLELENRDTAHIIASIHDLRGRLETWKEETKVTIQGLKQLDEANLIKDLIALYHKHGKPSIWTEVLNIYEVKYPKEKE
jgi:hypothetical protein